MRDRARLGPLNRTPYRRGGPKAVEGGEAEIVLAFNRLRGATKLGNHRTKPFLFVEPSNFLHKEGAQRSNSWNRRKERRKTPKTRVEGSGPLQKGLEACYCLWACHPDPSLGLNLGPSRSHPGSEGVRRDSPCALFYSVSDPSRSRGGGHPGPSWSDPAPERSFQDRAWTARNRLLGHFRKTKFPKHVLL